MLDSCAVEERGEQRVYPLLLDMQVDHYKKMRERGRLVAAADFELAQGALDYKLRDLLGRVLKGHDDRSFQQTFEVLALAERFDRETVDFVVDRFNTFFPGDRYAFLSGLSFIEADENGFLSVHKKIAEVSRKLIDDERREKAEAALIDHFLDRSNVNQPIEMTDEKALFIIEAANIRKRSGAEGYVSWLAPFGKALFEAGRYEIAENLWRVALAMCKSAYGEGHKDVGASCNNLAASLDKQGRYRQAEPLLRKALDVFQRVQGEVHPGTAAAIVNLVGNLGAQGRHAEAEPLFEKVLLIYQRMAGPDRAGLVYAINNLAFNLNALGRHEQAEQLYGIVFYILKQAFGEDHRDTASAINNLARSIDAQDGRHKEAEPLFRNSLDIRRRQLGEDHPDTAQSYNNLALNLSRQKRHKEAGPHYEKALEILISTVGEGHPWAKWCAENLANHRRDMGE